MPKRSLTIVSFLLLLFCGATRAQVTIGIEAGPDFSHLLRILANLESAPVSTAVCKSTQRQRLPRDRTTSLSAMARMMK